jgi:hypothetical protein
MPLASLGRAGDGFDPVIATSLNPPSLQFNGGLINQNLECFMGNIYVCCKTYTTM